MTALQPRHIPALDKLLHDERATMLVDEVGMELTRACYREELAELRERLAQTIEKQGQTEPGYPDDNAARDALSEQLHERVALRAQQQMEFSLRPVFNMTGTVIHTNLGRSLLPQSCIDAMVSVAQEASTLEFDVEEGRRGDRDDHIERLLCKLTGAEAATVVNNNAAAVLLVLNTVASGKPVAVARGELVEIGGSFRVPAIMQKAGCELLEVGTTNRTHPGDYQEAIERGAVAVMKVHTSNYRIEGFTASVDNRTLASLAVSSGSVFINDLGSGALVDLSRFGLPAEPTVGSAVDEGADIITFSGDKLLGGPQCGLIVGRKEQIAAIRSNPMKRAMRCDKLTLAALEALLKLYTNPDQLASEVPALRLLTRPVKDIEQTAAKLVKPLQDYFGASVSVTTEPCQSQIGSGALPIETLPSHAVVISPSAGSSLSASSISRQLRMLPKPVISRTSNDSVILDVRCLEASDAFIANLVSRPARNS